MPKFSRFPGSRFLAFAAWLHLLLVPMMGQQTSLAEVKAACLFNFVRYAAWPAEVLPAGAPAEICSMGHSDMDRLLRTTFSGRKIDNHPVTFRQIADVPEATSCHVLFLSGSPTPEMKSLRKSPRSKLLFIVGDDDTFSALGTLLYFSIEGGRVVFIANGEAIGHSQVHISSNLLSLAKFR